MTSEFAYQDMSHPISLRPDAAFAPFPSTPYHFPPISKVEAIVEKHFLAFPNGWSANHPLPRLDYYEPPAP
jgi:hypothetical protein